LKLHAQATTNSNTVTGYGPDYIEVNRVRHAGSLVLAADAPVQAWTPNPVEQLSAADFAPILALDPEIVLVGTGAVQRFLAPALTVALAQAGIGVEVMDTAAACRTYNILMAEGRRVVGAFLASTPTSSATTTGAMHEHR
jgi:uncharacterized protein